MNFFVVLSLLFALTSGAPQDLVTERIELMTDGTIDGMTDAGTEPEMTDQPIALTEETSTTGALPTEAETHDMQEADSAKATDTEAHVVYSASVEEPAHNLVDVEGDIGLSARPLKEQTFILNAGKHLSEAITAKIVGPVVIFNSKVATAAGALPPLLAAKGAVIGSAIATPIEIAAVAGSGITSAVTGKLVAIPISVASGALAKFVGAAETGRRIWEFNSEHGLEILKDGVIKLGHIALKPLAVVGGAQMALTGAGVGVVGTGIKGVGLGIKAVGTKMAATGLIAKGLGHRIIIAQFPPYLR